ncbi:DUF6233 domain-containing protein [Streptomyces rubiginosohelvolus]|uniref:DUF6233 domain-containing protein n=1 Tax=Streptomyces rubiginosohelvolus TaxID=67362 RepID=UPI00339FAF4A
MSEWQPGGPSRLDMLLFLERVQEMDLARTRDWIEKEQQRLAQGAAVPEYVAQNGPGPAMGMIHKGTCRPLGAGVHAVAADDARRLLHADVSFACQVCRPDTALGML